MIALNGIAMAHIDVQELLEPGLEALREEWSELCLESRATPFQFPQWLIPWWNSFGGSSLKTVSFRTGGLLAGFAPCFIYRESASRMLCLIGSGISDYLDVIVRPGYERTVAARFYEYLYEISAQWDECVLQDIPEESPLRDCPIPPELDRSVRKGAVCSFVKLQHGKLGIRGVVPKKMRKNVSHSLNALSTKGKCVFERASESSRTRFLEELFDLHRARWRSRYETGVVSSPALRSFYEHSSESLMKSGLLNLYSLRLDGKAIASYFVLSCRNRVYAYLGGFDPDMERYSPGTVALFRIMEEAFGSGAEIFDFLRGDEEYKKLWRPSYRNNYDIHIVRRQPS